MFVAAFLVAAMPSVGVTGDEGGAPRLARWLAARKVERERVAAKTCRKCYHASADSLEDHGASC